MNAIQTAAKKHEEAAKELMAAVMETYPIGKVITVTMGRSRFDAEVIGHNDCCWWHEPQSFSVRNLKTGKVRRVSATYEAHQIQAVGE